jgi:hypothetical protein
VTYCDGCGRPAAEEDHARCRDRRMATDPPRWCTRCGRKLKVQVLPTGWTAQCVMCDVPPATGSKPPAAGSSA